MTEALMVAFNKKIATEFEAKIHARKPLVHELTQQQEAIVKAFDLVLSGDTGLRLAGGVTAWTAGLQFRRVEVDQQLDDLRNRAVNPCPFTDPHSVTLGNVASLKFHARRAGA